MTKTPSAAKFGKIVKQMRLERGWTQDFLAGELDADAAYISRIENGKKMPSLETILKLATAFGVKVMFGEKRL
jgi:transcriptional regulator with XRE-family HTH domain